MDEWGIRVLQNWPRAPRELWPSLPPEVPGFRSGQVVEVTTPDGCRRCIVLPPTFGGTAGRNNLSAAQARAARTPRPLPMPFTELLVHSRWTSLKVKASQATTSAS